jgi:hypothetical protein
MNVKLETSPSVQEFLKQYVCDTKKEHIDHPEHYCSTPDWTYEVIKVIEAWDLGFHLGNVVKYVARAGKKNKEEELQDLKKALWYLQREIDNREKEI